MISCMCPYLSWILLNSMRESALSSTVSPIPIKSPVVNGIFSLPAFLMVPILNFGSFPGLFLCAIVSIIRELLVSSIKPIDAFTSLSILSSFFLRIPGLLCGKSPVFLSVSLQRKCKYSSMLLNPSSSNSDTTRFISSGCSPKVKRASLQLNESASLIISKTSPGFIIKLPSTDSGSFLNVQYPHSFLHIFVRGKKTFFE